MKKTIITIIVLAIVLVAVASAIFLIGKFVYLADGNVVTYSDFFALSGAENITVSIDIGYINISEKLSGENVTLDYAALRDDFYHTEVSDDTISITSDKLSWYDRARNSTADKYGVTIGVPANFAGTITIETSAGNVILNEINAGDIFVTCSAGNISISNVTSTDISIEADVGSVSLNSVTVPSVYASVSTGNIEFSRLGSELSSIIFKTHIGNIIGSLPLPRENFNITLNVRSGNTNVEPGGDGIPVELTADIGNIDVTFGK